MRAILVVILLAGCAAPAGENTSGTEAEPAIPNALEPAPSLSQELVNRTFGCTGNCVDVAYFDVPIGYVDGVVVMQPYLNVGRTALVLTQNGTQEVLYTQLTPGEDCPCTLRFSPRPGPAQLQLNVLGQVVVPITLGVQ